MSTRDSEFTHEKQGMYDKVCTLAYFAHQRDGMHEEHEALMCVGVCACVFLGNSWCSATSTLLHLAVFHGFHFSDVCLCLHVTNSNSIKMDAWVHNMLLTRAFHTHICRWKV
jgi:hypothetical protein